MKRIAIFSDIHGNNYALEAIIKDIKSNNIDEVICLGDTIAIGPKSKECLDLIIDNKISMVLGNHELYYLRGIKIEDGMSENEKLHQNWVRNTLSENNKLFLLQCPLKIEREFNNKLFCFEHFLLKNSSLGYPFKRLSIFKSKNPEEEFLKEKYDYIFFGHEHLQIIMEKNNKIFYDGGSSGCTSNDETFYTIIEICDDIKISKKIIKYDRASYEEEVRNTNIPDKDLICKHFLKVNL